MHNNEEGASVAASIAQRSTFSVPQLSGEAESHLKRQTTATRKTDERYIIATRLCLNTKK